MKKCVQFFIVALLLSHCIPATSGSGVKANNIDLYVEQISMNYPDPANESLYKMFSSNHPIANFDRPANLYVTDGVVGVESEINVSIGNIGTSVSGSVDVQILILHNEYKRFELLNTTVASNPIQPSSSQFILVRWTPYYSGNHTIIASVTNTIGDDDNANNQLSRHLTVARIYDNCVDISQWSVSGEWSTSSDAFVSQSSAFHMGNGQFSSYSPLQTSTLTSPVLNLADDLINHNAAIGYSFFYTGGIGSGDEMKGYVKDSNGVWIEMFTMQGVVDNNLIDGISWQTFSATYNGRSSPLIPLDSSHFHETTQLRFSFTSDSIGEDIGIWMDELVLIYDQAAKEREYSVNLLGKSILGGLAGEWSTTRLEITNTGNVSEEYTPFVEGLPDDWNHYFSYPSGVSVTGNGIEILPGETKEFDIKVKTNSNSTQGNYPINVRVNSNTHEGVNASVNTTIKILPSRLPEIQVPEVSPRCNPGTNCDFLVQVNNIGEASDVFTVSVEDKVIPNGWSIDLAWDQPSSILVRPNQPNSVKFTAAIPADAEPDVTAEIWLTAISQNDTTKFDREAISISAAMVSNASVALSESIGSVVTIDAGGFADVEFQIWNNASRIDVFSPQFNFNEVTGWNLELLSSPNIAINPGQSSTYTVRIFAPENAQANDVGPQITPMALSQRSGEIISGEIWQGAVVNTKNDLSITAVSTPLSLSPGVPTLVTVEVANNGNGNDIACISLPNTPATWEWWALVDQQNVTQGIPLSVSYDLENVKLVDIWIYLPPLEAPGEFHEIVIEVQPKNGSDLLQIDNLISFESVTQTVRNPRLDSTFEDKTVATDTTHIFNATAWNIGNAADTKIRARLVIETSPSTDEVSGFLSTEDGVVKPAGEWINLYLGPTEYKNIGAQLIISENCSLNTIVSISIQLEGGSDENNMPILDTATSVLIVAERRNVNVENIKTSVLDIPTSKNSILWVNISSTSTQSEILEMEANVPSGWGLICSEQPAHIELIRIELAQGHVTEQRYNLRCEVMRENGLLAGNVEIFLNSSDDKIKYVLTQEIAWKTSDSNSGFSPGMISLSLVIIVVLILIMLFVRKYRDSSDYLTEEEERETSIVTLSGPPASLITGPPASSNQDAETNNRVTNQWKDEVYLDPMEEYNRQLEEYNRKLAEYESWKSQQISNDNLGVNGHE